jgi:pimeloyl-ACP methyl ester carboxylesterase
MRSFWLSSCAVLFLALCSSAAPAQENSRHEILRSPDGFQIHITYYPFKDDKDGAGKAAVNAPVVILLTGSGENRLMWDKSSAPRDQDPFPVLLQKRGYAVISVDLRKQGESVINGSDNALQVNDYTAMVAGDMAAVRNFIFDEHQAQRLNMQKLGIVAVGTSVPIAAAFAEFDWRQPPYDDAPLPINRTPRGQTVKALVFISPETSAGRVKAATAMKVLRQLAPDLALQVIVGAQDSANRRQAESVFQAFVPPSRTDKSSGGNTDLLTPDLKDRGVSLIRQPIVYANVFKFLESHLRELNIPWRDRRSALERE